MSAEQMTSECCTNCSAPRPPRANYCPRCGHPFRAGAFRSTTRPSPLLDSWRQLDHTLTRKEIRKILGEPKRIEPPPSPAGDACERWIYEYESVADRSQRVIGELRIVAAESRLLSWTEPDWDSNPVSSREK